MDSQSNTTSGHSGVNVPKKAVVAAAIGNFLEYYDFILYGYFASVIAALFFPAEDPVASLLLTFAAFAVSYVVRPLGAIVFSHFGDKVGRRTPLAVSIVGIAVATGMIGILPTYEQIGVAAPILLVLARLVQGLSVAGEYGGALSLVGEYAPQRKRGLYTSWMNFTIGFSLLAGGATALVLTSSLSEASLFAWGWRIPFLLSVPLGLAGLYLRLRLDETPRFRAVTERAETESVPLLATLRWEYKAVLLTVGVVMTNTVAQYLFQIFSPTYLSEFLDYDLAAAQLINLAGVAAFCAAILPFASLSDRIGRKPLLIGGALAFVIGAYPGFVLQNQQSVFLAVVVYIFFGLALASYMAALAPLLVELFPTSVRYSGVSIGWNTTAIAFGGATPFIATYLISRTGAAVSPYFFVILVSLISLFVVALLVSETHTMTLRDKSTVGEQKGVSRQHAGR